MSCMMIFCGDVSPISCVGGRIFKLDTEGGESVRDSVPFAEIFLTLVSPRMMSTVRDSSPDEDGSSAVERPVALLKFQS